MTIDEISRWATRQTRRTRASFRRAGTARVVAALESPRPSGRLSAEELIRQQDPETLAQLAALLAAGKGTGEPA